MYTKSKMGFSMLVLAAPLFMALGALAQDSTDNSGEVLSAPPPPIRSYVLASPRACLLGPCITVDFKEPIISPCPRAGAENFPRLP